MKMLVFIYSLDKLFESRYINHWTVTLTRKSKRRVYKALDTFTAKEVKEAHVQDLGHLH